MPTDRTISGRFAESLRVERARHRMSQEELADRAGISLIESGKRMPRLDTLIKLAGALGVEVGVLVAGMRWEPTVMTPRNVSSRRQADSTRMTAWRGALGAGEDAKARRI